MPLFRHPRPPGRVRPSPTAARLPHAVLPRRARSALRRGLAAVLAAVAAGGTAYVALVRPVEDGAPVLVATREMPVGAVLSADDVTVEQRPTGTTPASALRDPAEAVGLPVSAVLVQGEVLTDHDVRTVSVLQGQPSGSVAVWLPVPEAAVAEALSAGDRVDVHSPVDGRAVVEDVLVVAVRPGGTGRDGAGLIGTTGLSSDGGGAWLALSRGEAEALAAARGADPAGGALLLALHPAREGGG